MSQGKTYQKKEDDQNKEEALNFQKFFDDNDTDNQKNEEEPE